MEKTYGEFCEIFGLTPRNIIIEFFLEMRGLDFSIGDIVRETGLNRATAYNTIEELEKAKYLIPTRKVSGSQLYILNTNKEEVKVLINVFNIVLQNIAEKYKEKQKIIA